MKKLLLASLILFSFAAKAQRLDSIYVHLYTDSLKKGTFNYINIDGLFSNGRFLPLDSTHLVFWSDEGSFSGNNLWLDKDFKKDKVNIRVTCRHNQKLAKEFTVYLKTRPDDEKLLSSDEILKQYENKGMKKR